MEHVSYLCYVYHQLDFEWLGWYFLIKGWLLYRSKMHVEHHRFYLRGSLDGSGYLKDERPRCMYFPILWNMFRVLVKLDW